MRPVQVSLIFVKVSDLPVSLNVYLPVVLQLPFFLGVRVIVEPEIAYVPPPVFCPFQVRLTAPGGRA